MFLGVNQVTPKLRPRQEIDFSDFRLRRRPLLSKSPLKCLSIQTFQIKRQNEAFRISCYVLSSNGPRGQRLGSILMRKKISEIYYRFWNNWFKSNFSQSRHGGQMSPPIFKIALKKLFHIDSELLRSGG